MMYNQRSFMPLGLKVTIISVANSCKVYCLCIQNKQKQEIFTIENGFVCFQNIPRDIIDTLVIRHSQHYFSF